VLKSLRRAAAPLLVVSLCVSAAHFAAAQETPQQKYVISVERIWDRAQHNAFTDIIEYKGLIYCAFREGSGHIPGLNGTIRILRRARRSDSWESVGLLQEQHVDLRDPKLSITPAGDLMINMGASYYHGSERKKIESRVCVAKLDDGPGVTPFGARPLQFGPLQKVEFPEKLVSNTDWLWRITWHKGVAYGCLQQSLYQPAQHVLRSKDGVKWEHLATLDVPDATETTLRFAEDDTMIAMIRRDAKSGDSVGYIGTAKPPYAEWQLKASNKRFGGPDFMQLPSGKWLAGSRGHDKTVSTQLWWLHPESGEVTEIVTLPSGGDTSYPGFVLYQPERPTLPAELLVSYYSSHEGKSAIYLATLRLEALESGE